MDLVCTGPTPECKHVHFSRLVEQESGLGFRGILPVLTVMCVMVQEVLSMSGGARVPSSSFACQNKRVAETEEFRSRYIYESSSISALRMLEEDICYRVTLGQKKCQWTDNDPSSYSGFNIMNLTPIALTGNYRELCTVKANLGSVPIPLRHGSIGPYYEVKVDIVLLFGLTELTAQVAWIENVRITKSYIPPDNC